MRTVVKTSLIGWTLWLSLTGAGLLSLANHASQPGRSAQVLSGWPARSRLSRPQHLPLLLSFIHPLCPCSPASLDELARIRRAARSRLQIIVVIGLPEGLEDQDAMSTLRAVRHIQGASVFLDRNLIETHRFGCSTWGQALLYSARGRLCYQGGLGNAPVYDCSLDTSWKFQPPLP